MFDSSIQHLAKRIHQTRSIDRAGKIALAKELRSLRARMLAGVGQPEIDRLEAAALLMAFLASADEAPVEALQVVARLTASLDERLFATPAPVEPVEPVASAAAHDALSAASRLGDILVHQNIVTPEQLAEALRVQPFWKLQLGACLEKLGAATGAQVARALELQARLRANRGADAPLGLAPKLKETRLEIRDRTPGPDLAEILIEQGTLTREQLEHAQRLQRAAGLSIGEALVQLNFATKEQIKQALHLQERLRR